jgi:aquaporin Z
MNKYVVELIGTFFLFLTIGTSAVLGTAGPLAALAIGATLMVMVYAGGHISGAHYNPAVTLAVFIRGRCEAKDVAPYIVAQLIGASLAGLIVLKIFAPAVLDAGKGIERFTIEHSGAAVAAELFYTFALAYVVLNVATTSKTEGNSYFGLAIGFTVAAGAFAVGAISLGGFNPAVSTALCITGKLGWADCWMHFLPQILGAVLAAFTFKALHPEDR